jgi:hypothetical protein
MKFNLRDLFWLTLLIAVATCWATREIAWVASERINEAFFQDELKNCGIELQSLRTRITELEKTAKP